MRLPILFCATLAAAAPLLARAQAPAAKLVPIDAFVERDQYSNPKLSPDGKHLAVAVRMKRGARTLPTMTIYSLPDKKVVSTIILPAYEIPANFFWLSNTRLIVKKGLELETRQRPALTGEVVAVNVDGSKQEYLYGYKGFEQSSRGDRYGDDYGYGIVAQVPEARDGHVFLGAHQWKHDRSQLYDINTTSSARKLLADLPYRELDFMLKKSGTPLFAYGEDEHNDPLMFRLDEASGEWRKLGADRLGAFYNPFAVSADDKQLYATYSDKGGPAAFVREDLATGVRTTLASDPLGDISAVEFSARPEKPFGARSIIGIPKLRYIDADAADAKLHQTLSGLFPDAYVDFLDFTDDGQTLLFSVRSDRDPGSFYLFDRKTGKADLLFANMQQIEPELMAERRPIRFAARDGLQLAGYLTLPANPAKKKLPMVLLPHGGPFDIADSWFFDSDAQFLASRGYAVLQVNYRGSGGRGVAFRNAGYRQWGGKILDDLADGVKWANAQPEIDAERVCVYGGSFGGYAALMLPVREPAMFKCAVGYSGQYDLASIYKQDEVFGETANENFFIRTMGNDPELLKRSSPVNLAAQITLPVLMVHGGRDKRTEIAQAEAMRDALIAAGHPPEWYKVDIEGHGFYDPEYRKVFYQKLEAFLDKHIGH